METPNNPKVSVIIPTFNRMKYLPKAIDSVLAQQFTDHEIVVVDDGSSDDTREVLRPYRSKIRYIYQDNQGVSAARNTGILASKGNWIAFLDSDDEWLPEYLEWQMLRVELHPNVVGHITNAVTILPDQSREDHFRGTRLSTTLKNDQCMIIERPLYTIIKHSPWFVQASLIRKDVLVESCLFDRSLTIGEDLDVLARVALKGPLGICNKQMVCIHRREEKQDHVSKIVMKEGLYSIESLFRVFSRLRDADNLLPLEKKILDVALSANRRALANLLLRSGRTREARTYYKNAVLINPSMKSVVKYILSFIPSALASHTIRKGRDLQPGNKK